ncbi:MAG TPA: hypothetical protein VJV96_10945, partial [Candidatus Angelobacter sp.]|nr:hypothetical protein [Candidatus Angelobacter sp.]
ALPYCSDIDGIFPSGSLNHATFAPPGAVHIPSASSPVALLFVSFHLIYRRPASREARAAKG